MERQTITVDIAPGNNQIQRLKSSQGDIGRPLGVYIIQNGVALDCSAYTADLYIIKPDGNFFTGTATVDATEHNLITWKTAKQETPVAGDCAAQIRILSNGDDIGTARFVEYVEASPGFCGEASESVVESLKEYVRQAAASAETASGAASSATGSASAASGSASAAASSASAAAGSASSAHTDAETASQAAQTAQDVAASIPADYTQLSEDVTGLKSAISYIGVVQKGQFDDGATLFTSDSVNEGDVLYYNFDTVHNYSGYINILDTTGRRITYIGKGSASLAEDHYEGSYTIPANFGKAVVEARAGSSALKHITVNYMITNDLISHIVNTLNGLPQIDDTAGDGDTAKIWSADKSASENAALSKAIQSIGIIQKGQVNDGSVLFSADDVDEGDTVYYSFSARANYCGYIDILDTSGRRITYIGKGTSSGPEQLFEGSYTVPANFEKAVVYARIGSSTANTSYMSVNYLITNKLIYDIMQEAEQSETPAQKKLNIDYKCTTQNRLANPLYTTFDKMNESETVITRDVPLNKSTESVHGSYRIPTCIITNAGTALIAAERRDNGTSSDKGVISVDLVRKTANGSWGTVTTVLPYNSTYGRYMDPCFVIDRTGAHGVEGRIYLFAGTFLNDDAYWAGNTYEESNMIYIYSDDDGVTWSSQVSVKGAWDSTERCVLPAPANGIQLTNGTLVIPVFAHDSTRDNNALFYKEPNGDWTMSAKNEIVSYNINENAIVEYESNKVKIYCNNNVPFPRKQYPDSFDRYCTPTFVYDFSTDTFAQIESTFDRNLVCQFSVEKFEDNFLMSFPDVNNGIRENVTIWASKDSEVWIRCFKAYALKTNGYSVLSYYDGELIVVFEDRQGSISFENLTPVKTLFTDSCEKYIDNVSLQDRLQLLCGL